MSLKSTLAPVSSLEQSTDDDRKQSAMVAALPARFVLLEAMTVVTRFRGQKLEFHKSAHLALKLSNANRIKLHQFAT